MSEARDQGYIPNDLEKGDKLTHVAFILDRSGSMGAIRDDIIEAFNEQVGDIRNRNDGAGEVRVSFVTFGGRYSSPPNWTFTNSSGSGGLTGNDPGVVGQNWTTTTSIAPHPIQREFFEQPVERLDKIDREMYVPKGMTPLYDAVGDTVESLEEIDGGGKDEAFLVIVLTDGRENHSRNYSGPDIASKVTSLQNSGRWTFVYIGTEHDLSEARDLGFKQNNMIAFTCSSAGVSSLSSGMSTATRGYMSARADGMTEMDDYGTTAEQNKSPEDSSGTT